MCASVYTVYLLCVRECKNQNQREREKKYKQACLLVRGDSGVPKAFLFIG